MKVYGLGTCLGEISLIAIMIAVGYMITISKIRKNIGKRIYLSNRHKYEDIVDFFVEMVGVIALMIFMDIEFKDNVMTAVGIVFFFIMAGSSVWILILWSKFRKYVIINSDEFTMYSILNKKLCTIYQNQKVYYAILKVGMSHHISLQTVIVFSNQPFEYYPREGRKKYRLSYDKNTQIVMPYNGNTMFLLDINNENWKSVKGKDAEINEFLL